MTFSSIETRDAFHKLDLGTQVFLNSLWFQASKQGRFLHVTEVTGGDVSFILCAKPNIVSLPDDPA